jgi:hypothetical protein
MNRLRLRLEELEVTLWMLLSAVVALMLLVGGSVWNIATSGIRWPADSHL